MVGGCKDTGWPSFLSFSHKLRRADISEGTVGAAESASSLPRKLLWKLCTSWEGSIPLGQ